jgi:hypothetical protein
MTRRTYLHHVCSLEGFELSPFEVGIDKNSLLDSISYERDPNFRAGGEFLGNQHGDIEETYSDMVSFLKSKQRNITSITMLIMFVEW